MEFEARHLIEALRSGVPSRSVGKYFSDSRPEIIKKINDEIENVRSTGESKGNVIVGKYGEGKTHLMNTVFSMASEKNMVVSIISLSKETPANNMQVLYKRILENTYLPGKKEPGIFSLFGGISSNSDVAQDVYLYALKQLQTDRLYYVLKALLSSSGIQDDDVDILDADIRGSFATATHIKMLYAKYCQEKASFNKQFVIKQHSIDYFCLLSHLFKAVGYDGWVILIDEAELIGRLARKSRENAYLNSYEFLFPRKALQSVYSLFAFSTSFSDEIIANKNEFSSIALSDRPDDEKKKLNDVLETINNGEELRALSEEELLNSISVIVSLYNKAYDKNIAIDKDELLKLSDSAGYLLRTKIRAVIEALDQISQYGDIGAFNAKTIQGESLAEEIDSLFDM